MAPKAKAAGTAAAKAKPERALRKNNSDTAVNKQLRDHFSLFDAEAVDVRRVGGKTFREQLKEDKQKFIEQKQTPGALYYRELREKFSPEDEISKKLIVEDEALEVDETLLKAVIELHKARKSFVQLQGFFESSTRQPNQSEAVGILRVLNVLKLKCKRQWPVCKAGLKFIARVGMHKTHKKEFQVFDLGVSGCWSTGIGNRSERRPWTLMFTFQPTKTS